MWIMIPHSYTLLIPSIMESHSGTLLIYPASDAQRVISRARNRISIKRCRLGDLKPQGRRAYPHCTFTSLVQLICMDLGAGTPARALNDTLEHKSPGDRLISATRVRVAAWIPPINFYTPKYPDVTLNELVWVTFGCGGWSRVGGARAAKAGFNGEVQRRWRCSARGGGGAGGEVV